MALSDDLNGGLERAFGGKAVGLLPSRAVSAYKMTAFPRPQRALGPGGCLTTLGMHEPARVSGRFSAENRGLPPGGRSIQQAVTASPYIGAGWKMDRERLHVNNGQVP